MLSKVLFHAKDSDPVFRTRWEAWSRRTSKTSGEEGSEATGLASEDLSCLARGRVGLRRPRLFPA
jgi:hypothetical protein